MLQFRHNRGIYRMIGLFSATMTTGGLRKIRFAFLDIRHHRFDLVWIADDLRLNLAFQPQSFAGGCGPGFFDQPFSALHSIWRAPGQLGGKGARFG